MKYKVVFFDWYDTLSSSLFFQHWKETEMEKLFITVQAEIFGTKRLDLNWMKGEMNSEDIAEIIEGKTLIKKELILTELEKSAKSFNFLTEEIPENLEKLKEAGYKIVLATDNMDAFSRWTVPQLSLHNLFEDILNSFYLKALKKHTGSNGSLFFSDYLKRNKIKPGESILIDDDTDNSIVKKFGIDFFPIKKREPSPAFDFLLEND